MRAEFTDSLQFCSKLGLKLLTVVVIEARGRPLLVILHHCFICYIYNSGSLPLKDNSTQSEKCNEYLCYKAVALSVEYS